MTMVVQEIGTEAGVPCLVTSRDHLTPAPYCEQRHREHQVLFK